MALFQLLSLNTRMANISLLPRIARRNPGRGTRWRLNMRYIKYTSDRKTEYREMLRDPRWIAVRRRILRRDNVCMLCGAECNLDVHHIRYGGKEPWSVSDRDLMTLCRSCHTILHKIIESPGQYSEKLQPFRFLYVSLFFIALILLAIIERIMS